MSCVRAKPAAGYTLDGKPRRRAQALTEADVPRIREIIDSLELATYASLARALGRDDTTIRAFCQRHGLLDASSRHQPVRATGIQGEIFTEIDRQNIALNKVAKELHVHVATVGHYRSGRVQCSAFIIECLAQIAGYRLVLAPL